ncbi:hypothetical protein ACFX43_22205 [Nocardioides sp. YIM B13467]|uniref:hypothetical protein n=1 Tax=Nocardioides sp. YIM B13467 TaxID=3366294 RepID=UPI00366CA880
MVAILVLQLFIISAPVENESGIPGLFHSLLSVGVVSIAIMLGNFLGGQLTFLEFGAARNLRLPGILLVVGIASVVFSFGFLSAFITGHPGEVSVYVACIGCYGVALNVFSFNLIGAHYWWIPGVLLVAVSLARGIIPVTENPLVNTSVLPAVEFSAGALVAVVLAALVHGFRTSGPRWRSGKDDDGLA